jgi:hypothetical protein
MASSSGPTPREVVLVTLLFVFLLIFNSSQYPLETHADKFQNYTALSATPLSVTLQRERPQRLRTRLTWGGSSPYDTNIVAHVPGMQIFPLLMILEPLIRPVAMPGWTIFDRLYVHRGVVYIVSDKPSEVPDLQFVYSKAYRILNGVDNELARLPTDEEIRVISTQKAKELFGTGAQIIDGVTVSRYRE